MKRFWEVVLALVLLVLITVSLLDLYTFISTGNSGALIWSLILLGEAAVYGWLWYRSDA